MGRISLNAAPASVKTAFAFVIIQLSVAVLLFILGVTLKVSPIFSSCPSNMDYSTVIRNLQTQTILSVALAAAIPVFIVGLIGLFACIFWETEAFVPLNVVFIVFNSLVAAETAGVTIAQLAIYGIVNLACTFLETGCSPNNYNNCPQCPFSSPAEFDAACVEYPRNLGLLAGLIGLTCLICIANAIIGCVVAASRRRQKNTVASNNQVVIQTQPVVQPVVVTQPVPVVQPVPVGQPVPVAQPVPVGQPVY